MKKYNKEIQIALVAILGVVVLYYGMQFLKGLTISSGSNYYVTFNDIIITYDEVLQIYRNELKTTITVA